MTFEYICFSITSLCNLSCDYCYRVDSHIDRIEELDFYSSLLKLKSLGSKIVNISGGEPLLHDKWRSFVILAHAMGYKVVLSTNGMLLDLNDSVLECVDEIVLPLDGSCEEINSRYRGKDHFDTIIQHINKYRESNYQFKLKIGTVVTRQNIDDLVNIIPLIKDADIYWRVFFCKSKGVHNHTCISEHIKPTEYLSKLEDLKTIMPTSIHFMYDCCKEDAAGKKVTTIVSADGNIFVGDDNDDVQIGNLIDMSSSEIIERVVKKGYEINHHKLYYDDII